MRLNVTHIIQFLGYRVVNVHNDDLPICLPVFKDGERAERFYLLDLARLVDFPG